MDNTKYYITKGIDNAIILLSTRPLYSINGYFTNYDETILFFYENRLKNVCECSREGYIKGNPDLVFHEIPMFKFNAFKDFYGCLKEEFLIMTSIAEKANTFSKCYIREGNDCYEIVRLKAMGKCSYFEFLKEKEVLNHGVCYLPYEIDESCTAISDDTFDLIEGHLSNRLSNTYKYLSDIFYSIREV